MNRARFVARPGEVVVVDGRKAYDPDQPRDPGGEDGGQWIAVGGFDAPENTRGHEDAARGLAFDDDDTAHAPAREAVGGALERYTGRPADADEEGGVPAVSDQINKALWYTARPYPQDLEDATALQGAIDAAPPLGGVRTVYRGFADAGRVARGTFAPGQIVEFKGLSSASYSPEIAAGFALMHGTAPEWPPLTGLRMLEIKTRRGLVVGSFSGHDEQEILLGHGSRWRVAAVRDLPYKVFGRVRRLTTAQLVPVDLEDPKARGFFDVKADDDDLAGLPPWIRRAILAYDWAGWRGALAAALFDALLAVAGANFATRGRELGAAWANDDPVLTEALTEYVGLRLRSVEGTTRQKVIAVVRKALAADAPIDQRALASRIAAAVREETVKWQAWRASTIARTETAIGYNLGDLLAWRKAGVVEVLVVDGDEDDTDQPCKDANGATWTVAYALAHLIEHPNCERRFAPVVATMGAGVPKAAVVDWLEAKAYDPAQPRAPKGDPEGGQWVAPVLTNLKYERLRNHRTLITADQGSILLLRTDDPAYPAVMVEHVETTPEARGRGYGTALYDAAAAYAVSLGGAGLLSTGAMSADAARAWARFRKARRVGTNEAGDRVLFPRDGTKAYDPAQPRAPKGDPEGGQWVRDAAALPRRDDDASLVDLARAGVFASAPEDGLPPWTSVIPPDRAGSDFASAVVRDVNIAALHATQWDVHAPSIAAGATASGDPHVVRWRGRLYVADGHHRVVAAWLRGETRVRVRIGTVTDDGRPVDGFENRSARVPRKLRKPLSPAAWLRARQAGKKAYDPAQPRAPKGTDIGGRWVDEDGFDLDRLVKGIAAAAGYDGAVETRRYEKGFAVGAREFKSGGYYTPPNDVDPLPKITVNRTSNRSQRAAQIIAHEVQHDRYHATVAFWDELEEDYEVDRPAVMDEIRTYIEDRLEELADTGASVSTYAAAYWDVALANADPAKLTRTDAISTAINETLAELAFWEGRKLRGKLGGSAWEGLYRMIHAAYPDGKQRRTRYLAGDEGFNGQ